MLNIRYWSFLIIWKTTQFNIAYLKGEIWAYGNLSPAAERTRTQLYSLLPSGKQRDDCFVIPEYAFAVRVNERKIERSDEHTAYKWVNYEEALRRLHYDSNKTALWELDARIKRRLLH